MPQSKPIDADDLNESLTTRWLGRPCHAFGTVGSTMDVAKRLLRDNFVSDDRIVSDASVETSAAAVGALVVADTQTAGRGTRRPDWASAPGMGIWASMILPADLMPGHLSLSLAYGVVEALESFGVTGLAVKWPNDVVAAPRNDIASNWPDHVAAQAKKLAGILVERDSRTALHVAGIGLNVNHTTDDFPNDLSRPATSVAMLIDNVPSKSEILGAILGAIERRLEPEAQGPDMLAEWNAKSSVVGRNVTVSRGKHTIVARAVKIAEDGTLVIDDVSGPTRIVSGTVRIAVDTQTT
jgi:BirA family transcriptional regulator, biotin operon repressor / biotin---[acetyl-CoA-carboxylase] ligase